MESLKIEKKLEDFEKKESNEVVVYINGVRRLLADGLAHLTLLEYLRDLGLTGTKLGCGEGGCGACTVMVSYFDHQYKKCVHYAVNACLAPLYSVEGMHVITVEGIGNRNIGLHPVQESLANSHGSQCGFCTPGFVMSMYALLRSSQTPPTEQQIEESLGGNLCRCTGYRPIIDAFKVFAKTDDKIYTCGTAENGQGNGFVCPSTGKPCFCGQKSNVTTDNMENGGTCNERYKQLSYSEIDGSKYNDRELIFPPELQLRRSPFLSLNGFGGLKWYRPLSLQHVLELKAKYPDAKLVTGNTEVGIEKRMKNMLYKVLVSVAQVPELNVLNVNDDGLEIGAAVRLSELLSVLRRVSMERAAHETSSCKAISEQLKWFAGTQIRNVASVGGNICTASPISDLNPLWMASGAEFQIIDSKGNKRKLLADKFFLGYRKINLSSDEILLSIHLPWTRPYEFVKEFKQAHRRDDDIALVNAGMRVRLEKQGEDWLVSDASVVYGGVAAVSYIASNTKDFLIGKSWNKELVSGALKVLEDDISLKEDAPGGMVEFRKSLTLSFFFKFFLWVSREMDLIASSTETVPLSFLSAIQPSHRPSITGIQDYDIVKLGTAVGSPQVHLSATLQVTGEAEYTGDVPMPPNGLHGALILSKKPHASIISIDDSGAKSSPGFAGVFYAKDVPGDNRLGSYIPDEEVFATERVTCVGQVIGVVVTDTHENAKLAARSVHVEYEELPAVLSIKDALKSGSYRPSLEKLIKKGDVDFCFKSGECDRIIEGEVQVGGQEHFYFETQNSLVWTMDHGNEVHMISSTQAPHTHQKHVSRVLGLPMSKVVCKTKRIGGAFGGKEERSSFLAAAASVASYRLNRPVKITLDRDVDMKISGQRHSFLGKYKVGFTNEGKVLALDLELNSNAGNSHDVSLAVLGRAMYASDNVYEIPHVRVKGNICFTNLPTNTAFRGFGNPQGMLIAENWIQRIAMELNKSPEMIRELNFQSEGSVLHHGQILEQFTLPQLWNQLKLSCDFLKARAEVDGFNAQNRWKKRGIAMVPTKFGFGFVKFMNQASALVHIYTDGTVLVTHGGVEMGQGLHTKVAQIAASAFDIPLSSVFISETSTDKIPNASPTAASLSSDLYGAAILDACEQIKARMKPVASEHNFNSFAELVNACYMERIDLSAHGFHIITDISDFDPEIGKGKPFTYYTCGAAFAEVEIDTLTGDFHTRVVDIVLDLGHSLNPAIDIGQIEGAFIQGLGWVALEELKWGDPAHKWISPGSLFTCGPGNYKIPSLNDIPLKFNVSLLKGTQNVKGIHSSRAVGEPPFFLASAVFFAIKDAIIAARAEAGYTDWFPFDNPATPERIRMACTDDITSRFVDSQFRPNLSI